jgi:outer membrane lipoprotein carrier protein
MRHGLLLAGIVLAPAATQPAQDPAAIAIRASAVYRSLTSVRADFHQIIEDRMIGTQESRGELVQAGTATLAMRFTDPRGDAIVLDGTYAWIYTPSTTPGQVIRMAIPSDPVYGLNVVARILDRPTERYSIRWLRTGHTGERTADVLEFIPRSADPLFSRAILWIDRQSALPLRMELDELTGMRRTLILSRIRVNQPVSRGDFTFEVPPGVRVVQR